MIAVIVRLAISVRENNRLLQQVRTDPLTGLGNRGGMQVDLEDRCGKATAEEPVAILLFDLNGFKRYNDTFGHPAGDELLTELGGALRDAVGEDGIAYRFGGDEFCVLLTCPRDRFEEVSRRAAMALTASQKGVDVDLLLGRGDDPARGRLRARGDPARRPAHVRAEGVAPGRPRRPSSPTRRRAGRPGAGTVEACASRLSAASSVSSVRPTSARVRSGSSARATSIAASSRAPISRCGERPHRLLGDRAGVDRRLQAWLRSGPGRARRRSRASGPSRAPRGRRGARSAATSGTVQARRNISAPARIASSGAAASALERAGRDPLAPARPRSARRRPRRARACRRSGGRARPG